MLFRRFFRRARATPSATPPPFSVVLLGDVVLGHRPAPGGGVESPEAVWGDVTDLLGTADLRLANLECVLAGQGAAWRDGVKPFHFRASPDHVATLCGAGIDAVSLANNHAHDFGPDALLETMRLLDAAGIAHVGAGPDEARAYAPLVLERAGARVAVVAFTDNEPEAAAGPGRPGTAYARAVRSDPRGRRVLDAVREARDRADLVIVSAHWGGNYGEEPRRRHRRFGRALLAAGAHAVHGHSAHVSRGVGWRRRGPVLYATGDAVHTYEPVEGERNDLAFVARVEVEDGRIARLRLHPLVVRDERVRRATGDDRTAAVARMEALCAREGSRARWDPAGEALVVEPR